MFYLRDGKGNELNWFDDLDNLFTTTTRKGFMLSDLEEDDKEYKLTVDVPGVKKEDIHISFDNKNLVVSVKQDTETKNEKKNYIRRERFVSNESRSYYLADADGSNIHAKLENGVLHVTVAKLAKQIEKENIIEIE
jgi:HSP20 family protein